MSWRVSTGAQSLENTLYTPVSATQLTPWGGSVGIPWAAILRLPRQIFASDGHKISFYVSKFGYPEVACVTTSNQLPNSTSLSSKIIVLLDIL